MNHFDYFSEIEETFIRRRGKTLLLSPLDWALIESWKTMGVPLHVALRGIESAFDSFAAKPRRRSVKSLLYCQEEVEAQFAEWMESQRGASSKEASSSQSNGEENGKAKMSETMPREAVAGHLARVRAELEAAYRARGDSSDELTVSLARAVSRIVELEADWTKAAQPDAIRLEASLTDIENLLSRAVQASLAPEHLAARQREVEDQLKPYRARMDAAVYAQTFEHLLLKNLREEFGVPRLSLFYM
jgi:hypothetical protein